jgi:hypothetical protein
VSQRVALLGCGKTKAARTCPARVLYDREKSAEIAVIA